MLNLRTRPCRCGSPPRKIRRLIDCMHFLAAVWPAMASPGFGQEITVPVDHQVYPLLQKAETLRLVEGYALRLLPLTRTAVHELLQQIDRHADRLSVADRRLLAQMLAEFTDPAVGQPAPPEAEIHLYRYEEGEVQVFVDARVRQTFRFSRNRYEIDAENISETLASGAVRARFGKHLFLGLRACNTAIVGENDLGENFDPDAGPIRSVVGSTAFSDQATGYLALRLGRFGLLVGRDHLGWGSTLAQQLALDAANEPFDMVRLTVDFARWRFSYLHTTLQGIAGRRYLAGHRLDWRPAAWLGIGVYETVVYGGRAAEPGYLNPLLPYHIMEHQLGDRDNNMLGFDWTLWPGPGLRFYGEVFIDDFSFNKPLGTYWGNKLAYLAGLQWAQPLQVRTLELFASFLRIDPFVYTHTDSINVYAHYGTSLGAKQGPNAMEWRIGMAWQPLRDARWLLGYTLSERGAGSIFQPHRPEDGESKGFLRGPTETRHSFQLSLRHQVRRDVFAGFDLNLQYRRAVLGIAGKNRWERFARFFVDVHY